MFKTFLKSKIISSKLNIRKHFSTNSSKVSVFPDQIVDQLKTVLSQHEISESNWAEMESTLIENIHFFDRDQYVDTVSLLAYANKGTEALWGLISRKIYDHELDLAQTYFLNEALKNCTKHDELIGDPISRNNLVWDIKWPAEGKLFTEKLL